MPRADGEPDPRPARRPDPDTIVLWGGLGLSVLLSVWLTWGIWSAGMPAGDDTAAHVVRARDAVDHFFGSGSLDGWQASFGLGYQQFLFIGPGFTLLVAAVQALSLGMLDALAATKVAAVVSFALVPLALAFLAWAFGLGRRAAGVAAVLGLVVSSVYGGAGLSAVFASGLLPNHLGSALLLVALGGVVLVVRRPSTRRVVFTAATAAALVATHPIAAIMLTVFAAAVVAGAGIEWFTRTSWVLRARLTPWLDRVAPAPAGHPGDEPAVPDGTAPGARRPSLRRHLRPVGSRIAALLAAGTLAIGMAGFVLVPLIAHRDLRGENSAWPDVPLPTRVGQVLRGEFLVRPGVAIAVLAGFAFAVLLAVGRRRGLLTLVLTPVLFLAVARLFIAFTPDNIVAIQLTNRAIADVGLVAVLPLAVLVSTPRAFATRVARATGSHPRPTNPAIVLADAAVPLALAAALVLAPSGLDRDIARTVTPTPSLAAMADELAAVVPPGARFATQRLPARERALTGMSHPDLWLAWASGANTLNIYNLESSTVFEPVYEAEHLDDRPPEEVATRLGRLGVSHLALIDADASPQLAASTSFREVWRDGSMAVLEVLPTTGQPAPASLVTAGQPVAATLVGADPQHLVIETAAPQETLATVAVAWSPKWRVAVNGQPVPTTATADRLLAVPLPAGPATVTLDFGIDGADIAGRLLSAASFAVAIGALVVARRRRSGSRAAVPRARSGATPGGGSAPI